MFIITVTVLSIHHEKTKGYFFVISVLSIDHIINEGLTLCLPISCNLYVESANIARSDYFLAAIAMHWF